jgi:hypothetical protein
MPEHKEAGTCTSSHFHVSSDVNNECNCTSTSKYFFIACIGTTLLIKISGPDIEVGRANIRPVFLRNILSDNQDISLALEG